jgi:catechol 2,3-dioxygenase-like lactoylglutathione lyase family enzyme
MIKDEDPQLTETQMSRGPAAVRIHPMPRKAILYLPFLIVFVLWTGSTPAQPSAKDKPVQAVESVGITVSGMERSVDFFSKVLSFEKVSDVETSGRAYETLQGLFGLRMRVVRMRLGNEFIVLSQYIAPPGGRPIPMDSRSHDLWFQHIAIVVSDMEKAYRRLRQYRVKHVSTAPQIIPKSNPAAAGISAFKFRDPDDHNLELLYFPPGKGDPRWQRKNEQLFLGIDHTAISISNTDASLKFYRDILGLTVTGESLNSGTEQERLDNLLGAKVRITGLRPGPHPPGIEFLEYLTPLGRRAMPVNTKAHDLWSWQTRLTVKDVDLAERRISKAGYQLVSSAVSDFSGEKLGFVKGLLVLDPDSHRVLLIEKP